MNEHVTLKILRIYRPLHAMFYVQTRQIILSRERSWRETHLQFSHPRLRPLKTITDAHKSDAMLPRVSLAGFAISVFEQALENAWNIDEHSS